MADVFISTYKAVGDAEKHLKEHAEKIKEWKNAAWEFTKSLGAVGFRPGHSGNIRTLMFENGVPDGWKKIQMEKGKYECSPKLSTKLGKVEQEKLSSFKMKMPSDEDAVNALGWNPEGEWIMNGYSHFWPTITHLHLPSESFYVRLPRQVDDGWGGRPDLIPVSEEEYMSAIASHNALVPKEKVNELTD